MSGGTFTLAWELDNGRRVVTDPIPHNADEATVNVAMADATRKDKWRDMLQNLKKLTDARGALSDAEQEVTIARAVEAARFREEMDITRALREAHKLTCDARVATMAKAKAAWAAFNLVARGAEREAGVRAIVARAKAAHAEATKAVHDIQDETAVCKGKAGVLAAYNIVTEAVAIAEKANETAVSAEAIAITAFDAHLSNMNKADKLAAETYAITFAASHDIGAANTAAQILFKKVSRSDAGSAWDVWGKANEEAVVARKYANNMHDKATQMLEDARALRTRVHEQAAEPAHMDTAAVDKAEKAAEAARVAGETFEKLRVEAEKALNDVRAICAEAVEIEADVAAHVAKWANNN